MNLSSIQGICGLQAIGDPTSTQVVNGSRIGSNRASISFTGDIAYAFSLESTTASDTVSYNMQTGVCSPGAGSPTITDGDGNDFEGVALPTMVNVFGYLFETPAGNTGVVSSSGGGGGFPDVSLLAGAYLLKMTSGGEGQAGSCTFSFDTVGDILTVTVIGISS